MGKQLMDKTYCLLISRSSISKSWQFYNSTDFCLKSIDDGSAKFFKSVNKDGGSIHSVKQAFMSTHDFMPWPSFLIKRKQLSIATTTATFFPSLRLLLVSFVYNNRQFCWSTTWNANTLLEYFDRFPLFSKLFVKRLYFSCIKGLINLHS